MVYVTVSHRTGTLSAAHGAQTNHRGFGLGKLWWNITLPFKVIGLLFEMVAHPDRFSLDDDK